MAHTLLITAKSSRHFAHIEAHIVKTEDGKIRNCTSAWDTKPTQYYDYLVFSCQISASNDDSYAWEASYKNTHHVDLAQAEKMVKTLRSINRKYEKLTSTLGEPESFGSYIVYIANSLKIKTVTFYREERSSYDNCTFDHTSLPDAKNKLNGMVKEMQADCAPDSFSIAA